MNSNNMPLQPPVKPVLMRDLVLLTSSSNEDSDLEDRMYSAAPQMENLQGYLSQTKQITNLPKIEELSETHLESLQKMLSSDEDHSIKTVNVDFFSTKPTSVEQQKPGKQLRSKTPKICQINLQKNKGKENRQSPKMK